MVHTDLTYITLSQWLLIVYQVFGGCCTNVFVLENLFKNNHSEYGLGSIITFSQFLFVSLISYFANTDFKSSNWRYLYLKQTNIPVKKWGILVIMYFTVSILNNQVARFNITIPVHIIFRSCGTVVTMIIGYLFAGKSYNRNQIISGIIITLGILISNIPLAFPETPSHKIIINYEFLMGISILLFATILSAFMGLFNESLFKAYGTYWQESLFYTHFLALPLFLFISPLLLQEFKVIWNDDHYISQDIPISNQFISLLVNVGTQYLCIRGVNILASKTSALTVTVALIVRKFISLLLSVLLFDNKVSTSGYIGSIFVLGGAFYYSVSTNKKNKQQTIKRE
ncbi:UAA transporter [Scheffersomyces amazonensis]|uniref:UAA transporter n=1 Tax=Scheffersomyces amazonensis TaxID=1078765 RepID=UPI00315CD7F1